MISLVYNTNQLFHNSQLFLSNVIGVTVLFWTLLLMSLYYSHLSLPELEKQYRKQGTFFPLLVFTKYTQW